MDIETEKSELVKWIIHLKDHKIILEILKLKSRLESKTPPKRAFGGGKNIIGFVAEDFNEPLDDFNDYMSK